MREIRAKKNIVIVHRQLNKDVDVHHYGDDVDVFYVDENAPDDRIYLMRNQSDMKKIREILMGSKILLN